MHARWRQRNRSGKRRDLWRARNREVIGDSACHILVGCAATGAGGNDYIDLGPDGGGFVIGDNNSDTGSEIGAGNDVIVGGGAAGILVGDNSPGIGYSATGAGNDVISGFGGNDTIFGDSSADAVSALGPYGANDDLDGGGAGNDVLKAGPGNDALDGGVDTDGCEGESGQ